MTRWTESYLWLGRSLGVFLSTACIHCIMCWHTVIFFFQWDPLDITDWVPVEYARKAELANGRVAMLATVGWIWPRYIGHFEGKLSIDDPIAAARNADLQWWAQFIALCGVFELYKYTQEKNGKTYTPQMGSGDAVYDIMGLYPEDAAKRTEMELAELKNARLAMLGIAGFASSYFIPGSVPWAPFS